MFKEICGNGDLVHREREIAIVKERKYVDQKEDTCPILVQKSIDCVSGAFYSQKLLKPAQKTY